MKKVVGGILEIGQLFEIHKDLQGYKVSYFDIHIIYTNIPPAFPRPNTHTHTHTKKKENNNF